jgi:DNA replication ATP-dependent helicase Dna2
LFHNLQERHGVVGMTLDALAVSVLNSDINNEEIPPFDTVIVDEAGMNGFPKIAIAAAVSRRLILVGDPLQLPPIVRAWSFRGDENYKRSHFEVLQMMRPDLSCLLEEQFRCHPDIYSWSEGAVYAGKVKSEAPKRPIPIGKVLGVDLKSPVVWIDTSQIPGNRSEQAGTSRVNATHTRLALEVLSGLARSRIAPDEVGYIAPFRAQAENLRHELDERAKKNPGWARMVASTVDAFQGNERRVILFDLTTLHPAKPHEDHRRLNVSLTRAQELLIIIGPRPFVKTPKENPFLWSLQNWAEAQTIQPALPPN